MAFFALGDVITAALYQTGRFTHAHTLYVWGIIAGSGVGLLASTLGRLYSSSYYALGDTRSPLRFAVVRLILTTVLGLACVFMLPGLIGLQARWGAAGLTASAGVAGWVEFVLLRQKMNTRIGATGVPVRLLSQLWGTALCCAAVAWWVKLAMGPSWHPILLALVVLGVYGCLYFLLTYMIGVEECRATVSRILRRIKRR
jgi:putative peptidoglycan lipid II flippase